MFSNLSFGNKLLFQVLGAMFVILSIMMFFIIKYSYDTAENDAKAYIYEVSAKNAGKVKAELDRSITISKILASKYTNALKNNYSLNEKEVIGFASDILNDNPFIVGIWFKIKEKEQFFKANMEKAGTGSYDITGQFNPYITKTGNKISVASGSPYSLDLEWVKEPKKLERTYITKPYLYPVKSIDVNSGCSYV
jgi:methyl-accepting chemotaxis protein